MRRHLPTRLKAPRFTPWLPSVVDNTWMLRAASGSPLGVTDKTVAKAIAWLRNAVLG